MKTAYLTLESGEQFCGQAFGAIKETVGEIVFTTAMTGYNETLTDPSYYGQIVVQTFPLIGNCGVIPEDFEAQKPALSAYIVKHPCNGPSNFRSAEPLDAFLSAHGIAGLCGIDTRRLTKCIRVAGVMNGKITYAPPTEADRVEAKLFKVKNAVNAVSGSHAEIGAGKLRVALLDYGAKRGIERALLERDCRVRRFACDASADEILSQQPDGIVLSNGPGDPADPANAEIVQTVRVLHEAGIPIMGICLGHQLLALANGFRTMKLKFGHRGANQPVKDAVTGRVYITSQNHGYAVDSDKPHSFTNMNDGTCEGLDYGVSFSVQFHPEACGGPRDTSFLFDRFVERICRYAKK